MADSYNVYAGTIMGPVECENCLCELVVVSWGDTVDAICEYCGHDNSPNFQVAINGKLPDTTYRDPTL